MGFPYRTLPAFPLQTFQLRCAEALWPLLRSLCCVLTPALSVTSRGQGSPGLIQLCLPQFALFSGIQASHFLCIAADVAWGWFSHSHDPPSRDQLSCLLWAARDRVGRASFSQSCYCMAQGVAGSALLLFGPLDRKQLLLSRALQLVRVRANSPTLVAPGQLLSPAAGAIFSSPCHNMAGKGDGVSSCALRISSPVSPVTGSALVHFPGEARESARL